MNQSDTPAKVGLSDQLGLLPERAGQPRLMTVCASPGYSEAEQGHWYSPAAVREFLSAERERRTLLVRLVREVQEAALHDSAPVRLLTARQEFAWRALNDELDRA